MSGLRVTDEEAMRWKLLYEGGQTIEEIALDVQRLDATVRKHLHRLGTEMRPAHGPSRPNRYRNTDGVSGKREPPIPKPIARYSGAHRRRGWLA